MNPYRPPQNEEPDAPFTSGVAVVLTLIAFSLTALFSLLIATWRKSEAAIGVGAIGGFAVAFAMGAPLLAGSPAGSLGFTRAPARTWVAAALFVPIALLASEIENVIHLWIPRAPAQATESLNPLVALVESVLVAVLVLPALFEIFFRGLLQPHLVSNWGSRGSVFGSALLCSLPALLYPRSIAGWLGPALLASVLRRSSGSILPGLLLGVLLGVVHVLGSQEVLGIPGFDQTDVAHTPITWLAPAVLMIGAGLALCRGEAKPESEPRSASGGQPPQQ